MATKDFSDIYWAFDLNDRGFISILFDTHSENQYYLRPLNELFRFLKGNHCKNIQDKLRYVADLWNFKSILSELEMAEILIKKGKKVEILPDNYEGMVSPPDLHVTDDIFDTYVEVTRITDDQTIEIINAELNKIIQSKTIPYAIDLDINNELSTPAFNNDRDTKREKILHGIKEFEEKYHSDSTFATEITSSIGSFKLRESKLGKGYLGKIFWGSGIPYEKIIEKIRQDVIYKSQKREKWKDYHLEKFYIVALDFEDIWHDPMYLESALFGATTFVDLGSTSIIKKAIDLGWQEYLIKMNINPSYQFLDPNRRGIYFTSIDVKNVSGVIGKFKGRNPVFYPNPFAKEEIGNPALVNFFS